MTAAGVLLSRASVALSWWLRCAVRSHAEMGKEVGRCPPTAHAQVAGGRKPLRNSPGNRGCSGMKQCCSQPAWAIQQLPNRAQKQSLGSAKLWTLCVLKWSDEMKQQGNSKHQYQQLSCHTNQNLLLYVCLFLLFRHWRTATWKKLAATILMECCPDFLVSLVPFTRYPSLITKFAADATGPFRERRRGLISKSQLCLFIHMLES